MDGVVRKESKMARNSYVVSKSTGYVRNPRTGRTIGYVRAMDPIRGKKGPVSFSRVSGPNKLYRGSSVIFKTKSGWRRMGKQRDDGYTSDYWPPKDLRGRDLVGF